MKKLILGIFFISTSAFGQEFNFDIQNTTLDEYLKMEQNLGSERIATTSNHVSFSGEAQPIKFLRNEKVIPDLIAFYFFKEADSSMSYILYEWDISNFEKKDNNQKSIEFQTALIEKYQSLKNDISKDFGKPKIDRNYSNISQRDSINTFVESSTWKPDESTEIEMYATVSNYYEKKGMVTINPVHRVRLYIKNQSKEKEIPKLDDKKLAELNNIKNAFFKALEARNLQESKKFLSNLIIDKVSDDQITRLIDNIDFARETELIYSGIQTGINGRLFTILYFKYSNNNSSIQNETIKLTFDDKDKVAGIQPMIIRNN